MKKDHFDGIVDDLNKRLANNQTTPKDIDAKRKARRAVRTALERGIISRPKTCSKCGATPKAGKDGRALIQADHADYSNPLEIDWVCSLCHVVITGGMDGEKNGRAKLSESQVAEVRNKHKAGKNFVQLAAEYGLHRITISRIVKGILWKN